MPRLGKIGSQIGKTKIQKGKNVANVTRNLKQKIQRRYRLSGVLGFGR